MFWCILFISVGRLNSILKAVCWVRILVLFVSSVSYIISFKLYPTANLLLLLLKVCSVPHLCVWWRRGEVFYVYGVLSVYMSVDHLHAYCPRSLKEDNWFPETGVRDDCKFPYVCWNPNLSPLQEQPVVSAFSSWAISNPYNISYLPAFLLPLWC